MNKYEQIIRFTESLTILKVWNFLKLKTSYFWTLTSGKIIVWGKPFSLSIEPSSFCNLGCEFCPTGQKTISRPPGNMELSTSAKIINELHPYIINLFLYFQGEPFLNKNLFEIIDLSKNRNIYTVLSTNGNFLDYQNSEKIIESGLDKIIISLDGLDQKTYETYRKNGQYFDVIKGIENLVSSRNNNKTAFPFIEIQFLVFSHNQDQINDVIKFGKHLGADRVSIKTAQIYSPEENKNWLPERQKFSRYRTSKTGEVETKRAAGNKCKRIWDSTVVAWNGDIVPCCFDKNADFVMGNINTTLFSKIWKDEKYMKFRKTIFSNRKSIEICGNCGE